MSRSLPANPSFEQLKKQAKDLRKAHRSADPEAAQRIKTHLPRLAETSEQEILETDFALQEAQHVISREYGCKHWEMLQAVVEVDLDAVTGLDDRSTQVFLREVDQKDMVVALKGATPAAREKFLSNMSARVRGIIKAEIQLVEVDADEIESTRRRLLQQLANLAFSDSLDWSFETAFQNPLPVPGFHLRKSCSNSSSSRWIGSSLTK